MSRNELLAKYQSERTRCESFSRVMGYIRNKNSFNDAKQSEAAERVYFTESCACGR